MYKRVQLENQTVRCWYLGVSTGGFSEKLAPGIGDKNLRKLRHTHGTSASTLIIPSAGYEVVVAHPNDTVIPAAALITSAYHHGLILRPADCIPLVLTSAHQPLLGLVHCGRRELEANIIQRAVELIAKKVRV